MQAHVPTLPTAGAHSMRDGLSPERASRPSRMECAPASRWHGAWPMAGASEGLHALAFPVSEGGL